MQIKDYLTSVSNLFRLLIEFRISQKGLLMRPKLTIKEFREALAHICDKKTSLLPSRWRTNNPLIGYCPLIAVLAQDVFGGTLLKVAIKLREFPDGAHHYWNKLADGTEVDFATNRRFNKTHSRYANPKPETREHVLGKPEQLRKYLILKRRLRRYTQTRRTIKNV